MYRGFGGNRLFHDGGRYHTENSANQWTGFYMITASVMKELKSMNPISRHAISFVNHPKQLYVPLTEVKILAKKSELSERLFNFVQVLTCSYQILMTKSH